MNILVVHRLPINHFPPVRNLIEVLLRNGHCVTIITKEGVNSNISQDGKLKYITIPEYRRNGKLSISLYLKNKFLIRKLVKEEMRYNEILWTTTDCTVRELGKVVLKYKHVMQLMELIEDIPAFPKQKLIGYNIKRFARKAYKVVVPEYNRAHIQKIWWGLKEVPTVLPNKMTEPLIKSIPDKIKNVLDELEQENRKIILYQGVFLADRDLDAFAKVAEKLSDNYCFYIMGRDSEYREFLCEKYKNIKYIPFIDPPFHLLITPKAYIGLLPYRAANLRHYSILNALFCAPNKIFEYAYCGVPMIGTDVPGLSIPFSIYDIGVICKNLTPEEIEEKIKEVEKRYEILKCNCFKFYESVDLDAIVSEIING